jgi:acetylornithine deacetylase/succinyl-diaminopimelate desuccinylase-like protein
MAEREMTVAASAEAVAVLARRARQLTELSDKESGWQVAVTELAISAPFESLPDTATITATARFNEPEQGAELDEKIRRVLKKAPKGARFNVRGGVKRPPRQSAPESRELYDAVAQIADELSLSVGVAHRWHSSDLCFVPGSVPALDGFGPLGTAERTIEEHIVRGTLTERAALIALTIAHCASLRT